MDLPELLHLPDSPWIDAVVIALSALVTALLVALAGGAVLLRLAREGTVSGEVVRRARTAARFALPLLALQMVWGLLPERLPLLAQVEHLNSLLLIGALTWLAVRCVTAAAAALVKLNPHEAEDNLQARRILTQARVLSRSLIFLVVLVGASLGLMTFPTVRHLGTSLLASAGVLGLVVGLAAKSVLGNLLAGLQLALTQPIRFDDVLVVQGEWGRVEEITGTYVVLRLWDERRLVVPLQWFIENPFANWTRTSSRIIGSVFWWVDYAMPLEPLRHELKRLCEQAPEWDGRLSLLQVTDASEKSMQLRALVTSMNSDRNWDLRCRVREGLIAYMQREYPQHLPLLRAELAQAAAPFTAPASP